MKRTLALVVIALCLAGAGWGVWDLYQPYCGFVGRAILEIPAGTSAETIADLLVAHGVLAHKSPFLARYGIGRVRRQRLKAGEYLFDHP